MDNYGSKIDWDFGSERVDIFDWPPKGKFDRDNTLIIRRNRVIEPKLKPMMTPSGDLFKNLWPGWRDSELIKIDDKDIKRLREMIIKVIERQIRRSEIKNMVSRIKLLKNKK